jgi:hypothetical protein
MSFSSSRGCMGVTATAFNYAYGIGYIDDSNNNRDIVYVFKVFFNTDNDV